MQKYDVMTVGELHTGRTCFHIAFECGRFPDTYIPTVCDILTRQITLEDTRTVDVTAYEDSSSGEDYDRLRPLSYPGTDVFIGLYSVDSRNSLEELKKRWIPEVRKYCPNIPIIIVGNKIDLRKDGGCETISPEEGMKFAEEMGTSYYEVSCLELRGIEECFKLAVELVELNTKEMKRRLQTQSAIIPPIKPVPAPEPVTKPAPSTFADDWRQMISDPKFYDVTFIVPGGRSVHAHRLVLCAASPVFQNIFIANTDSKEDVNAGKYQGIKRLDYDSDTNETVVELSSDIRAETFDKLLEFAYTGSLSGNTKDASISDLRRTAQMFEMNQLDIECHGVGDASDFNLTDVLKPSAMREFLKGDTFSDIVFDVEGTLIPAHKGVIQARCPKIADIVRSLTIQGVCPKEVKIPDATVENFTILLEFLYTDLVDAGNDDDSEGTSDLIGLVALANLYGAHRLVTLYEVKMRTLHSLSEDNAIQLLRKFKASKTTQLVDWCRHYISHNYSVFFDKEEFSKLDADDKKHITDYQWPPLEYAIKQLAFHRKILDAESASKKKCAIC